MARCNPHAVVSPGPNPRLELRRRSRAQDTRRDGATAGTAPGQGAGELGPQLFSSLSTASATALPLRIPAARAICWIASSITSGPAPRSMSARARR